MRKVNYEVVTKNGDVFYTTSYKEAKREGNRLKRTFLVDVDMTSEKEHEWMTKHANKIQEILKAKRG